MSFCTEHSPGLCLIAQEAPDGDSSGDGRGSEIPAHKPKA